MQIDLIDVTVRLSKVDVLENFTARFRSGTVTALVGPSGSGKTTALALVAGNIRPTRGEIVLTSPVDGVRTTPRTSNVAWVPQGSQMLPGRTVIDNAMIGPLSEGHSLTTAFNRAARALELLRIGHLQAVKARRLSGGEAQRLAFARAVATTRPVILADEPTANLDRSTAARAIDIFNLLDGVRTVVIATHDDAIVGVAAHVVRLGQPRSAET